MTPAPYSLALYRGDTYRYRFSLWTDVAHTTPADLTGATVKSEIRDKSGGTKVVTLACTITLPNIVDVVLSSALCLTVPSGGVWDLQVTFSNGDVATPLAGTVSVSEDVTDSIASPGLRTAGHIGRAA